MAKSYMESQVI